ncbi:MAG: septum formation initiator family protein [Bryobacteraceae bacterium]|jgi:cell division protein FtsB
MKVPFGRIAYVVAFFLVAGYAVETLCGPRGVHALLEKQDQIQKLEQHNAALAKEVERMREHIKRMDENPSQQELEIRDRLKLVRPGEKVFITGDPDKPDSPR